ncbi:unnamed protein product [Boreogadus saida]
MSGLRGGTHIASHYSLHSVLDTLAHAANFLNSVLQTNRSREHTLRRDIHWYHALVRSVLEGDPKIHRAVLTFPLDGQATEARTCSSRPAAGTGGGLQDLSDGGHLSSRSPEAEWFNEFRDRKRSRVQKRAQEVSSATAAGTRSYFLDKSQIRWSAPYLECEHGALVPYWLLTLSAGFYGLRANALPEFR